MITFRPADAGDRERLRAWRNDAATRAASRRTDPVSEAEHASWLAAVLADPVRTLLIALEQGAEVGMVRFDCAAGGVAEISLAVAPDRRGQGLGARVLAEACRHGFGVLHLDRIAAEVRETNAPSRAIFERAGFVPRGIRDGFLEYELGRPSGEMHGRPA